MKIYRQKCRNCETGGSLWSWMLAIQLLILAAGAAAVLLSSQGT
jgi:hypothetical protein